MATKSNELGELKAMLLALSKDLQEARADITWLRKQMFDSLGLGPKRAVITLPYTYELGDPFIVLTVDEWALVKSGARLEKYGNADWWEISELPCWDHWVFEGGYGGQVTLAAKFEEGDEFEVEQRAKLTADLVDEFQAKL